MFFVWDGPGLLIGAISHDPAHPSPRPAISSLVPPSTKMTHWNDIHTLWFFLPVVLLFHIERSMPGCDIVCGLFFAIIEWGGMKKMTRRGREARNGVSCIPPVIPMDRASERAPPWLNMWVTCGRSWRREVLFRSAAGQIWQ